MQSQQIMNEDFLPNIIRLFSYYKKLGEGAIQQIEAAAVNEVPHGEMNSLAVIVQHLHGNMLSRFTDMLSTDGEKPWRNRDAEFENKKLSYIQVIALWQEGWSCLLATLESLRPEQLQQIVYIRNEGHTVIDAVLRQLAHYSYHVGQVVWVCQYFCKNEWQSLSIAKGKSEQYNKEKMTGEKDIGYFTDKV